jgi:hypothetical protein
MYSLMCIPVWATISLDVHRIIFTMLMPGDLMRLHSTSKRVRKAIRSFLMILYTRYYTSTETGHV